jgi:serine/threonine protein kinase
LFTQIFFVMEMCGPHTLSQYCRSKNSKKLSEQEAYLIFIQLLLAVKYLHSKGIYHRDLKMTNVLIDDKRTIKLIDFGFADNRDQELTSYCGTPSYMAPEIVEKRGYRGKHVDMWALAVILFKLLTGEYAFGSRGRSYRRRRHRSGSQDQERHSELPQLHHSCLSARNGSLFPAQPLQEGQRRLPIGL